MLLVSVGTGVPPELPFEGNLMAIAERLKDITTDTEEVANTFNSFFIYVSKNNKPDQAQAMRSMYSKNIFNNSSMFLFPTDHGLIRLG